jgi:lipopolysaccharide transport system ATP-binding protein
MTDAQQLPIISATNLGKAYPAGVSKLALAKRLLIPSASRTDAHQRWVFRGLNFDIARGEAVAIIGANGAGKSTLLKVLTSTSAATEGSHQVNGEVSALLELGMGFHPDFTGRQNAFLSSLMAGREREEIVAAMDNIESFAEIGEYFHMPVRTYSSGMQVRLAFAVATAFSPDILIVDEALAVGDTYFQHKSFNRIREFRERGATLLFVSHDPGSVKSLCNRALFLGDGKLLMDGSPDGVLDYYNALIAQRQESWLMREAAKYEGRSGDGRARIQSVRAFHGDEPKSIFRSGEPMRLQIAYECLEQLPDLTAGFIIRDRTGYDLFGTNTWHMGMSGLGMLPGKPHTLEFDLPALALGPGSYSVTVALHSRADHLSENYDWWDNALVFQVVPGRGALNHGPLTMAVEGHLSQGDRGSATVGVGAPTTQLPNAPH